jgi:hypothetical protein
MPNEDSGYDGICNCGHGVAHHPITDAGRPRCLECSACRGFWLKCEHGKTGYCDDCMNADEIYAPAEGDNGDD